MTISHKSNEYTISSTINGSITFGLSPYPGPLSITNTGQISPPTLDSLEGVANGAIAVLVRSGVNGGLRNSGTIAGGHGQSGASTANSTAPASAAGGGNGGFGGYGVGAISSVLVTNYNVISGGRAGNGGNGGNGGSKAKTNAGNGGSGGNGALGGDGVGLNYAGTLANIAGQITAGNGGNGGNGGRGGNGGYTKVSGGGYNYYSNGSGGNGGNGGNGGAGANLGSLTGYDSLLVNQAIIIGGNGGGGGNGGDGGQFSTPIAGPFYGDNGAGGNGGSGGNGVDLTGAVIMTNAGNIIGGNAGGGGAGGYTNDGEVDGNGGNGGAGVDVNGGGVITNTGIIIGGLGGDPGRNPGFGGTDGKYGNGGVGVYLNGGTLINDGTIIGGDLVGGVIGVEFGPSADAVSFGAAAGALVVDAGASFAVYSGAPGGSLTQGIVAANAAAADRLELAGTASGTLYGIGTNFLYFNTIGFAGSAYWAISGNQAGLASGQTITGFGLGDAITLDGFNAISGKFVTGAGLILTSGASHLTLNLSGDFATPGQDALFVQNAGTNSVISLVAPQSIVSTDIFTAVTLDNQIAEPFVSPLSITNTGELENGVRIVGGTGTATLVNAGDIGRYGIFDQQAAIISNSGLISAGEFDFGVDLINAGSTLLNTGNITAGEGTDTGYGVYLDGATLINAGVISDGNEAVGAHEGAVLFGQNASVLIVDPGAVFNGGVIGNEAVDDTLELNGASKIALTGIGTQFTNFSTLDFAPGANWAVAGNLAGMTGLAAIEGFATSDTLFVDGFSATASSFIPGIGLELSNASNSEILNFSGDYANGFLVINPGGNTEIRLLPLAISSGTTSIGAGTVASNPVIGSGAGLSVSSGATVASAVIAGGTLELGSGSDITGNISFSGDTGRLVLDAGTPPSNTITGFAPGDSIKLMGVPYDPATDSVFVATPGVVTVDADGTDYEFNIAGAFVGETGFSISGDLQLVDAATCFCAGTRILTEHGERAVETLEIGERVKTVAGQMRPIKWIGRRDYDGRFIAGNHLILPVRIAADALGDGVPARDLCVSPGHAIFVDGALVPAWRLLNGVSIRQESAVGRVQYFHIELETHDVILAENCPAESFLDAYCRQLFQNAATYEGDDDAAAPVFERVESGFRLAAISQRLAARAGVAAGDAGRVMRGYLDQAGPEKITGWAQYADRPETPVCLDVRVDGRRIARLLANLYRADLRKAGLGSGCHAFEISMPAGMTGRIDVCVAGNDAPLTRAEMRSAA